jgi:putative molybdenum carrier protein
MGPHVDPDDPPDIRVAMRLTKIVSGGQTGVDRAALDAALAAIFPCGGWTPRDRMAEDGVIPEWYPLTPLPRGGYRERTRRNVVDSDGTAIIYIDSLKGGTRLTRNLCVSERKAYVLVDAQRLSIAGAVLAVLGFIDDNRIDVLNVAGPRASGWSQGYDYAFNVVSGLLKELTQ